MAIKEEELQDAVIDVCDSWLEDHGLNVHINQSQSTEEGRRLIDAWNDWYNDSVLLPVNQAVDEAITNGGYETLSTEDIRDICDSVLSIEDRIFALMDSCYRTGFRTACDNI